MAAKMATITAKQAREMRSAVHNLWPGLVRPKDGILPPANRLHFKHNVEAEKPMGDLSGIPLPKRKIWIPTKNPVVVPGGEFEESYYWDSLLISVGILGSPDPQIRALAKGIADNFMDFINDFGFVPNSNMPAYLTRSQPPVLSTIVRQVYENHKWASEQEKIGWLRNAVDALEKEYKFWTSEPRIAEFGLSRYADQLFDTEHVSRMFEIMHSKYMQNMDPNDPNWIYATGSKKGTSPESAFRNILQQDDQFHARTFDAKRMTQDEKTAIENRRTVCESGWDYSRRAMPDKVNEYGRMHDLIAPDLNAFLAKYETDLAHFYRILARAEPRANAKSALEQQASSWDKKFDERKDAMNRVLFNPSTGLYHDYDLKNRGPTNFQSLAAYLPLWAGIAEDAQALQLVKQLPLFIRTYGLAISLERDSPWQWDGDRGWAPLHQFTVEGLLNYGYEKEACGIMGAWLAGNNNIFEKHGVFIEKINVSNPLGTESDRIPQEGRYGTMTGFGWTNGTIELFYNLLESLKRL